MEECLKAVIDDQIEWAQLLMRWDVRENPTSGAMSGHLPNVCVCSECLHGLTAVACINSAGLPSWLWP